MEKRHRIFIAINPPDDIKRELFAYSEKWPDLPAKWTPKNNLHITLEFLGALTDEELGGICEAVKKVAERQESFSVSLKNITYGPGDLKPKQSPKFIWASGEKSKELSDLKIDLQNSLLEKARFKADERAFSPHITLARISSWGWKGIESEERPEINEDIDLVFTVESIDVMESELKRGGPQYTLIESHQLK